MFLVALNLFIVTNDMNDTGTNFNITTVEGSSKKSSGALLTAIGVILAVLVVICALIQFILYKGRTRNRMMNMDNMVIMNPEAHRGMELGDEDDEFNLDTSGSERVQNNDDDKGMSMDTVHNGIISNYNSVSSDLNLANKFGIEMREEDLAVDDGVGLGEIELESSHMSLDESKPKQKGWDMTPLGDHDHNHDIR